MKVVALVSGGKDSCYAMMKCIQYGHEIVALANLMPADESVDELDSYMYQTVGHQIVVSYAECIGVPLFRRQIKGSTRHQKLNYKMTTGDEVEDMFVLLKEVKRQIPSVTAVSSGAIASDYQRLRVESICSRLGLVSLAYLWKQDQSLLLDEMIANEIVAITVKVAAMGLVPGKHLGKEISFLKPHLHKLKELYGCNVCGEGGEYETLTLDCPLFVNARIVLDESQILLHSPDSIAPVGILHPSKFHLERKGDAVSGNDSTPESHQKEGGTVIEVQGDCPEESETICQPVGSDTVSVEHLDDRLCISRTTKDNTFSMSCWLQDSSKTSPGVKEDLRTVLKHIESQLAVYGFGWGHVLYIHLYIADMNEFASANETYVAFITQEKCPNGVPSRSTIELPLVQAALGKAYVEVLVANDDSKNVLHVQSISSWAPSCIGPYSQATLHHEILYMAGQLGLHPPTMTLSNGGATAELELALQNSEAVAKSFNCSISTNAISFTVYCSNRVPASERQAIEDKQRSLLREMRLFQLDEGSKCRVLDPVVLYVLVPDLPKRALVEVKPTLFVPDLDTDNPEVTTVSTSSCIVPKSWGFQRADWQDACIQKCVVTGKICTLVLSITTDLVAKINSTTLDNNERLTSDHLKRVMQFCIYLLDEVVTDNCFTWEDITSLRLYFPTSTGLKLEALSVVFGDVFAETGACTAGKALLNVVPVLSVGRSAAAMEDLLVFELFARRS
ncbi:Diphthine--ammonia ligase [Linum grandiflorum]